MIRASFLLVAILLFECLAPIVGFTSVPYCFWSRCPPFLHVVPLQTNEEAMTERADGSLYFPTQFLDWNASGSIGSLLMQMQKKEEEMRKYNKTLLDKNQAVDLSRLNSTIPVNKELLMVKSETKFSEELDVMDPAKARELDEAVTLRISSSPGKDAQILELPELYRVLQEPPVPHQGKDSGARESVDDWPLLSRPEHYEKRIGRDMRQLAVSIAACIDDAEEFQTYCRQIRGGVYPLLECIREGADAIRQRGKHLQGDSTSSTSYVSAELGVSSHYEERFLAASSACRALRDLCGISSDLAVVITDTLLRANANKKESNITEDLVTILQYAHEADISVSTRSRKRRLSLRRRNESSKWKLNFSPNRRGTYVDSSFVCTMTYFNVDSHGLQRLDYSVNFTFCSFCFP